MKKKILKWGQTPWDKMNKDELLRETQRMYSALRSLYAVVKMDASMSPNPYYYGKTGVGGKALEKGRQIIEPLFEQYKDGEGDIYRAFFRYADDLLFENNGYRIGDGWCVCDECGGMCSATVDGKSPAGDPCSKYPIGKKGCRGTLRLLTWEDLK